MVRVWLYYLQKPSECAASFPGPKLFGEVSRFSVQEHQWPWAMALQQELANHFGSWYALGTSGALCLPACLISRTGARSTLVHLFIKKRFEPMKPI